MIAIKDASVIFNQGTVNENKALQDINLDVKEGDFITIIGSNGAGKSTLFNLIAGTITPTVGTIHLKGRNITREPEYKRAQYIGRIFQNPLLGTASNMSLADHMMITHNMSHAIEYGNRLLMMDQGGIIFDVSGDAKQELTVEKLVQKFHELRHHGFENDRALLSG